jgi:glutathione S-transferase
MSTRAAAPAATLELWQTEWCPSSGRVRERLTELGLPFTARQVPVEQDAREDLQATTGQRTIPVLVADGKAYCGEQMILGHLTSSYDEPPGASLHRDKAAKLKRKELDQACPEFATATR